MKSGAERAKAYRERQRAGAKSLVQWVAELDARLTLLEQARPYGAKPVPRTDLEALRQQINSVPAVRPYVQPQVPGTLVPIKPMGEWESA